jgi:aspartate aminotransferase
MPVADAVKTSLERSSWIRRMFEEGRRLKEQFGSDKVFDFSLGNPDLEPPAAFLDALKAAASTVEAGTHAYMPNAGYPFARAEMAAKVSAEHAMTGSGPADASPAGSSPAGTSPAGSAQALSGDEVILTVGAAGAINVVLKTILNPGDEVLVIAPYFAEYSFYIDNHRGTMVPVQAAPDFSLDPAAVAAALGPRSAAIIINTPNNPSGRVYPRADIEALAAVLAAHGKASGRLPYLIIDEPYRDIVYDKITAPPVMDAYSESIVVSSFSKTLSVPGERIGYIAVNPAIGERKLLLDGMIMANRILGFVNAPALMQRAVAASWRAKADVSRYERRRNSLTAILDAAGIGYARPEGAFYLFCEVPQGQIPAGQQTLGGQTSGGSSQGQSPDVAFAMHLKEFKILAVPGVGFGKPGWFRLSYCVPEKTIEDSGAAWMKAVEAWKCGPRD